MTGRTVITRESEWDDEARGRALRLQEFEASVCQCGCNLPVAESHRLQPFRVHKVKCYAAIAITRQRDADAAEAKKNKLPEDWNAGLHYVAEPVGDDEPRGAEGGN